MQLWADITSNLSRIRSLVAKTPRDGASDTTRPSLKDRSIDDFLRTWDLGFTAFGGPPVHFKILHQRFVEGQGGTEKWIDEQTVSGSITRSASSSFVALSNLVFL